MAVIKLDAAAFAHNINVIKGMVETEKISIVLKDNAYGHGLAEMAEMAAKNGIRHAVVRRMDEAQQLASLFETVLVLADTPAKKPSENIHITLNSMEQIAQVPEGTAVHLKIDSGMHRNGITPEELERAVTLLKERGLVLQGLFSHVRSGDELSSELFWQYKNFEKLKAACLDVCDRLDIPHPIFHLANSAALLRFGKKVAYDRVRIGIAAYGYHECDPLFGMPELRPVLSLWADRIATRRLRKGERVGYGGSGFVQQDGAVSTYDLGYADGLFRHDGGSAFEPEEGVRIVGKISMDNLSAAGDAKQICLIRDARTWAKRFKTISYEILVKLSPHIKKEVL